MKNVVITGAGSGIGAALAKVYVLKGYMVYATKLEKQEAPFKHSALEFFDVDFLKDRKNSWMSQLPKRIDIFITNAGVGHYEKNAPPQLEDPLYVLNTLTPIRQFHVLKQQNFKGTFVVMGSVMAFWPLPGYARYAHTKSALIAYFKALQFTENADIVLLMPVAVQTPFFEHAKQPHTSWLIQKPDKLAKKMIRVIRKKKQFWVSSKLFQFAYKISPKLLNAYLKREARLYQKNFNEAS